MDNWKNKVAIVTGASSGIGAAIAKELVQSGMKVVGLARRKERIDELAKELSGQPGKLYSFKTDLTKEEDIVNAFKWTIENVGPISVLINNAGVAQATNLYNGETEKWKLVLDTNVMAVAIASREAVKNMRENNIDGYIININSVAGHIVIDFPGINMYTASKFALTAMTETLRLELARLKSNIRITSISPGYVRTEMTQSTATKSEEAAKVMANSNALEAIDIAQAALYVLSTPQRVQVTEITIKPGRAGNTLSTP